MASILIKNAQIVTADGVVPDQRIVVRDGNFDEIGGEPAPSEDYSEIVDLEGRLMAPGFIDIQVNGGGGVLFNDDPGVEAIEKIAAAHRAYGATSLLPTLISDDLDKIILAIDAADRAIAEGVPGVVGVHVEGPFLNPLKKGIHDKDKLRGLTEDAVRVLTSAKNATVVVTLAPECVAPEQIKHLAENGVRICAGHTNASYDETKAALAAGVTGFTHLFNAMPVMQSRDPGVIPAALESSAWCGVIADGKHVHPAMLRLAYRAKADKRFMLVTDAMPVVGSDLDHFFLGGKRITVKDGACLSEDGTLAGAALTMIDAFRNAMSMMGADLSSAAMMASGNPARFLGLDDRIGSIAKGRRADFVVLGDDLSLQETWIGGARVNEGATAA